MAELAAQTCAMAAAEHSVHWEDLDRDTIQQLAGPEAGKSVVAPGVVRQAMGKDLDGWILAAQVEHDGFLEKEAVVEATQMYLPATLKTMLMVSTEKETGGMPPWRPRNQRLRAKCQTRHP